MTLSRLRRFAPRSASGLAMIVGLSLAAACGGTTEPGGGKGKDTIPATVTPLSADTLRGTVGGQASLPLTVTVKNAAGEPLDTVLVSFAVTSGNGTVANASIRTNASGQASTTWTLGGSVGLQTATATVGTLAPVTFRAVATVGAVATITKVQGDAQSAPVGTNVAVAPQVKVVDQFGNAISGAQVSFAVTAGGGGVLNNVATSDANGLASAGFWRLGTTLGSNTLVASSGSVSVSFTATATFGAPATITLAPTTINDLIVGQTQQLTPRVLDASGNVISSPTVAYSSANAGVAQVSQTGLITATGAGLTTITATAGTATASVAVAVIGHPTSTQPSLQIQLGAIIPSDIAFNRDKMFIPLNGQQKILAYDQQTLAQTGTITVLSAIQTVLAPTRGTGPILAVAPSVNSRIWVIDPTALAVVDSFDIAEVVTTSAMTSTGSRALFTLSNGDLVVFDPQSRTRVATLSLGGGITSSRIEPGDTLFYAVTNVGVIFEVDLRTLAKRQIIASINATDFTIGRDGYFYLLDGPGGIVRIFDLATQTTLRSVGVGTNSSTLAVSPDGRQIWVTQTGQAAGVTVVTGSVTNGFIFTGSYSTGVTNPTRVVLSPSGHLAAIGNFGGFVDIVR